MTPSTKNSAVRLAGWLSVGSTVLVLGACSVLQTKAATASSFYALAYAPTSAQSTEPAAPQGKAQTLVIGPVRAASGFDSQHMIYVREPLKLEYFAHSEWIDTPARMLGPLMVASIEQTGTYGAVVMTVGAAGGDLRLDSEIVRLQQDFQTKPSTVEFSLRVYLVDEKTRKVLAWRVLNSQVKATDDNPRAGAAAANRAVAAVLEELARFLAQSAK